MRTLDQVLWTGCEEVEFQDEFGGTVGGAETVAEAFEALRTAWQMWNAGKIHPRRPVVLLMVELATGLGWGIAFTPERLAISEPVDTNGVGVVIAGDHRWEFHGLDARSAA